MISVPNGNSSSQREFHADKGNHANPTISDLARQRAASAGDEIAFVDGDGMLSFADCDRLADKLGHAMRRLGICQGDVVAFLLPNFHEAAIINLAIARIGAVALPIVPIYRHAEVRHMLHDSGAKMIFTCGRFRSFDSFAMIDELRGDLPDLRHVVGVRIAEAALRLEDMVVDHERPDPDFPAVDSNGLKLRLYTSGTTGMPKAVLHGHNALRRIIDLSWRRWGAVAGDRIIMPTPVTHISGYSNGLELPFVLGTCTILMESWNAADAVRLIDLHKALGTVAATPFLTELVAAAKAAGSSLGSFRVFACGGASVPPALVEKANQELAHPCAFRVYGSSEVPLTTFGFAPGDPAGRDSHSDGEVVDYEVRIVNDDGTDLPFGQEGEILVRGPCMFLGYADPDQTAEALTKDGWFQTGDLGSLAADGALTITGRKKDLIIRGGENLSAREIEEALELHPAISEAAVVAMPHPRLGEGVCAVLVASEAQHPALDEFSGHLQSLGLARQKWPERVVWMADLPRTASGKVKKDILRKQVADSAPA